MNIDRKKLDEFKAKAMDAKCPKDVFGDNPDIDFIESISKQIEHLKSSDDYTLRRLEIFVNWALYLLRISFGEFKESYKRGDDYILKISILVQEFEGKKSFRINTPALSVFFRKLNPVFYGYHWMDRYEFIRDSEKFEEGHISYYGTHGATEVFMTNQCKVKYSLSPDDFEIGDVINIYTVQYRHIYELLRNVG